MQSDPVNPQGHHTSTFGNYTVTIETPTDLDALLDRAAAENPQAVDSIPYYAIIWPAAHALAQFIWQERHCIEGRSVIELGCGLGLPAILAALLGAQVTATDFHPDNGVWLLRNASLNKATIKYHPLDWNVLLPQEPSNTPLFGKTFDVVIGSDLLYERRHIPALVCAIGKLCAPNGEAIIADPGRDNLALFVSTMERTGWHLTLESAADIYICRFQQH